MKTIHNIVPAAMVLAVLLVFAFAIGMLGRGSQQQQEAPLVDNGPNAGLSNKELVSTAITNMKMLKSYHFDFKGGMPAMDVRMSSNLSITADVQLHGNGARWRLRDEGGGLFGGVGGMNFDIGAGVDGIRATKDHWYESYDGGKTWSLPESGDTQLSFLLLWLDCRWGNLFEDVEETGDPTICEAAARHVDFIDGTPRLGKIDGAVTRHMTGVYGNEQAQASGQAATVDVWVSTDITPTLRQMRIQGSSKLYDNIIEQVNEVTFSPDGKTLAAAHGWAQDGTIRLYDLNVPGTPQRKLTNGMRNFESVDFSPDGKLLVATSLVPVGNGPIGIYIWDMGKLDSMPITRTLPGDDVLSIAFQPDGKLLAAGGHSGIHLLDPRNLEATPTVLAVQGGVAVNGMAFSPDGLRLAAGTGESGALVYDLRNPKQNPIRLQHEGPEYDWNEQSVVHVAFSPDGQLLATVREGHVNVWDLSQPQAPLVTLPAKLGQYPSAAFSPDGKFLALLGQEGQVEFWDVSLLKDAAAARNPTIKLESGSQARLTHLGFSPDGKRLEVSTEDGRVLVWKSEDVLNGKAAAPQVFKDERKLIDKPFTLTWTWSRFNEDFGEVKPPPADTIKKP